MGVLARRPARRAGAIALAALLAGIATGCATGDGRQLRDPVFDLPEPPVTLLDVTPQEIPTLPPFSSVPAGEPVLDPTGERPTIEIERLSSPANATAEMVGTGALVTDAVTVDDEPADVLSFEVVEEGRFTLQVWIENEGAHTVCVADACGRIYTLAPDAESP